MANAYISTNDRFTQSREVYSGVEAFQAMCEAALGERADLTERGGIWVDEHGTPTLVPAYLMDYDSGDRIRHATVEESEESIEAARGDGGRGVITVDGRRCYVD